MRNWESMKKRFNKLSALLILGLLLIGMSLACYVWMRKEQRQYALDRQLIAALMKNDAMQALVPVEEGADPSTREVPSPAPSLPSLINQLLHLSPPKANTSSTAFLIACGAGFGYSRSNDIPPVFQLSPLDPHLMQAMLLHGAKVNAKDPIMGTALGMTVINALVHPAEYNMNKEIIKLLLAYGADPDE